MSDGDGWRVIFILWHRRDWTLPVVAFGIALFLGHAGIVDFVLAVLVGIMARYLYSLGWIHGVEHVLHGHTDAYAAPGLRYADRETIPSDERARRQHEGAPHPMGPGAFPETKD